MNILTIMGSPRLNDYTARLASLIQSRLQPDHKCHRVDLVQLNVNGCLGCEACQSQTPGQCVQQDDAQSIFDMRQSADAVIYASPLYAWGVPSLMKAFIDRHHSLVFGYGTNLYHSLMHNKAMALAITCGGPVEHNADLVQIMFDRIVEFGSCRCVGKYVLPYCASTMDVKTRADTILSALENDLSTIAQSVAHMA